MINGLMRSHESVRPRRTCVWGKLHAARAPVAPALAVCLLFPNSLSMAAQQQPADPVALVLTYSARPGEHNQFRNIMRGEGILRLQEKEKAGIFRSYQAFLGSPAGGEYWSLLLVLRFDRIADVARWQKIQEDNPGDLPADALPLATILRTDVADIVSERFVAPETAASQDLAIEYDVLVDSGRYRDYVRGYVVPQLDGWEKAGALTSYTIFVNRNPARAPWSSLILLRYRDLNALGDRERLKDRVRAELATTNPAWKQWSEVKSTIRREKGVLPLRSLDR